MVSSEDTVHSVSNSPLNSSPAQSSPPPVSPSAPASSPPSPSPFPPAASSSPTVAEKGKIIRGKGGKIIVKRNVKDIPDLAPCSFSIAYQELSPSSTTPSTTTSVLATPFHTGEKLYGATITAARLLTSLDAVKIAFEVELDISSSGKLDKSCGCTCNNNNNKPL